MNMPEETKEKILEQVEKILSAHNDWEQHSSNPIDMTFEGDIKKHEACKKLIPNSKNAALMDVALITPYSGKFTLRARKKYARKREVWYTIYEECQVVEVGTYWDRR